MKICQVLASQGEGGLEKHGRELVGQLAEAGHEMLVFGDADIFPENSRIIRIFTACPYGGYSPDEPCLTAGLTVKRMLLTY
jgi:hypothetical protein